MEAALISKYECPSAIVVSFGLNLHYLLFMHILDNGIVHLYGQVVLVGNATNYFANFRSVLGFHFGYHFLDEIGHSKMLKIDGTMEIVIELGILCKETEF